MAAQRRDPRRSAVLWAAILIVLGLALAVGSGALRTGGDKAPSVYQRTLQLAGEYRCPVCQGESVAASSAPEAVEIKSLLRSWLQQGRSEAEIRSYLVARYGPSILEEPPASGLSIVVWALPCLAVGLGAAALGFGFRRWRRAGAFVEGPTGLPGPPDVLEPPTAPAARAVPGPAAVPHVRARRRQQVVLFTGVALMVVGVGLWALDRLSAPRVPGGTITGGLTGIQAELQQASALAATDPVAALAVYDEVLTGDPAQPVALTAEGWIYAQAGFAGKAMGLLDKAERADPSYGPAHFYRALVLLDYDRQPGAAVTELKWYLSRGPDPSLSSVARKALGRAESEAG